MKTIFTLILTTLLLSSCITENEETAIKSEMNYNIEINPDCQVSMVTIDSCQYIATTVYFGHVLTHKGNCTNHKYK